MPVTRDLDFMFIDLSKGRNVQMNTCARSSSQQVRGLAQMSEPRGSDGLLGQSSIVDKTFRNLDCPIGRLLRVYVGMIASSLDLMTSVVDSLSW